MATKTLIAAAFGLGAAGGAIIALLAVQERSKSVPPQPVATSAELTEHRTSGAVLGHDPLADSVPATAKPRTPQRATAVGPDPIPSRPARTSEELAEQYRAAFAEGDASDALPRLLAEVAATARPENNGKTEAGHVIFQLIREGALSVSWARTELMRTDLDPAAEYALASGCTLAYERQNAAFAYLATDLREVYRRTSDSSVKDFVVANLPYCDQESIGGIALSLVQEVMRAPAPHSSPFHLALLGLAQHHPTRKPEIAWAVAELLARTDIDETPRFLAAEALWLIAPEELEALSFDPWVARSVEYFREHGAPNLGMYWEPGSR